MDQSTQAAQNVHLAKLKTLALALIEEVLDIYFPAIDERLMDLADASSSQDQWDVLSLARKVKERQKQLDQIYESALCEGFLRFSMGQLGGHKNESDTSADLFLVSTDEMEREIAISSLAKRAETRHVESLYALNQRMAIVNGGKKIQDDGNPIGPHQFADALNEMLIPLELNTHNQVLFCKVFENLLVPRLEKLYEEANDYFVKEGILPNLRYEINKSKTIPKKPGEKTTYSEKPVKDIVEEAIARHAGSNSRYEPVSSAINNQQAIAVESNPLAESQTSSLSTSSQAETPAFSSQPQFAHVPASGAFNQAEITVGDANYQQHMVSAIRQFQGKLNGADSQTQGLRQENMNNGVNQVPVDSSQLVSTLNTVQHSDFDASTFEETVVPALTAEHFQSVSRQLEKDINEGECIATDHGRVIDLVGMIFEYMLGDDELPDSIKSVLSYLHTPFLKIALLDADFFEQANHPARQLLNLLADAGHRWVNFEGESQFNAFPKIKAVVRRVMLEFNNELSLFEELLKEMQEFNSKVEHKAELLEKRVQEKVQGEERLRTVKRRVYGEIKLRMAGTKLPAPVIVLLLHPCADYMTFIFLRYGELSMEWKDSLQLVDDILWSIQPKTDQSECSRLVVMQHELPEKIRTVVKSISFSQTKSEKLIGLLTEVQNKAFANQPVDVVDERARVELENAALGELAGDDPDESTFTESEKEVVEQLSHLEFGTWFEFDEFKGKKNQRLKLSWYNINTMRFMLVDSSGHKVEIENAIDLARLIIDKHAKIISGLGKPFFERALENILVRLKGVALH